MPPRARSPSRARTWCLTLNNPTDQDEVDLNHLSDSVKRLLVAREHGESGTEHFQGYVQFKSMKSLAQVKSISQRAHWEVAKGSPIQNEIYCRKGDQSHEEWLAHGADGPNYGHNLEIVIESGPKPSDGGAAEKARWKRAIELATQGELDQLAEESPDIYLRHYSTVKRIRSDSQVKPAAQEVMENYWWYGASGTGKSKTAHERWPEAYIKKKNKWWDGYVGQETVIIDEWGPDNKLTAPELKDWCDHHPFAAETKGGYNCLRPRRIVVLSNYSMEECFGHDHAGLLEPLKRRFARSAKNLGEIRHFGDDHPYLPE